MGSTLLFLLAGIGIGAVVCWNLLNVHRQRIAEETRRAVMSSVMDVHNNFLNNMVYFRARAEAERLVSDADLLALESIIRETQADLAGIAAADLGQTRDLGGIRTLRRARA